MRRPPWTPAASTTRSIDAPVPSLGGRSRTGSIQALSSPPPASGTDQRASVASPVAAIVPAGEEEVYDLTVPGPSNWLADGVVSHNSGAIEQDADIVMFIYREEEYKPSDENRGIAEIIVGKQRNGPTGSRKLAFIKEFTRFENLEWRGGQG